ncbi:MAG: hypothetical protein M3N51_09105 [Actinomycetota bacterium]|nr:hypothetical protein [Actinomycetota bacterium]
MTSGDFMHQEDLDRLERVGREEAMAEPVPDASAQAQQVPLLPEEWAADFRRRWETIQAGFVDEPQRSVDEASRLVGEVMDRLSAVFEDQRRGLEGQWEHGEASTEDLRMALQRYRSFFERLLRA